jgi:hypothetical protein
MSPQEERGTRMEDIFGVFTTMKIQVEDFWVVTPCSDVTLVSYYNITRRHNPEDLDMKNRRLYPGPS